MAELCLFVSFLLLLKEKRGTQAVQLLRFGTNGQLVVENEQSKLI